MPHKYDQYGNAWLSKEELRAGDSSIAEVEASGATSQMDFKGAVGTSFFTETDSLSGRASPVDPESVNEFRRREK